MLLIDLASMLTSGLASVESGLPLENEHLNGERLANLSLNVEFSKQPRRLVTATLFAKAQNKTATVVRGRRI